jgi:ABC-type nitrate/sulfonate/bicarbonate transport system substrate-binding protein
MVDDLMKQAGIPTTDYEMVRVGMNVTDAIMRGTVDTGIGFTNFQRIELEELTGEKCGMLRIDELDGLGCCCFCSIQFVASNEYYNANKETINGFMRAMRRAMDFTIEYPDEAWDIMCKANPRLNNALYTKIYQRTLPYFSRDLNNVQRDWSKVGDFCKHLNILEREFDQNSIWTNEHVPLTGHASVQPVTKGGVLPGDTSPFRFLPSEEIKSE